MFERSRVDTRVEPASVPVELELIDGSQAKGKLMVPSNLAPLDALNSPGCFLEFVPYAGEARLIAKSTIASIRLVGVPRASPLRARGEDFDPHSILGVSSDSEWDDIRSAYVHLSKSYHPDRYAQATLPAEVADYLDTMARRINAAYAALETAERNARRFRAEITPAVYTSRPRV